MFAVAICMHFLYDLVKMARNEKIEATKTAIDTDITQRKNEREPK